MAHSLVPLSPAVHTAGLSSPSLPSLPQTPPIVLEVPQVNRRLDFLSFSSMIKYPIRTGSFLQSHIVHQPRTVIGQSTGTIVVGLGGALWSWKALTCKDEAMAAARRPPPPPPKEKKDPTVSGVQAKVLASKKRKEEMKASIAKLREKGKPVVQAQPTPSSSQ